MTTTENPILKYLFTATYLDGTVYQQNTEDKSVKEPDKRSCYFDIEQEKLAYFVLKGDGHEYGVDLRDGHFEIDGNPFFMHEGHIKILPNGKKTIVPLKDFRLIFFRQHTHHFKVGQSMNKEIDHEVVYRIGWQCTIDGQNYQQVMQIK